jgi:hypothetical protein
VAPGARCYGPFFCLAGRIQEPPRGQPGLSQLVPSEGLRSLSVQKEHSGGTTVVVLDRMESATQPPCPMR